VLKGISVTVSIYSVLWGITAFTELLIHVITMVLKQSHAMESRSSLDGVGKVPLIKWILL